jgi:hypothetical protein
MAWVNYNFLNLFMGVLAMLAVAPVVAIILAECNSTRWRRVGCAMTFAVTTVIVGEFAGVAASVATLVSGFLLVSGVELQMRLYYSRRRHEVAVYQSLGALAASIAAAKR